MQSEIHRKLAGNRNSWDCSLRFIDREIGTSRE